MHGCPTCIHEFPSHISTLMFLGTRRQLPADSPLRARRFGPYHFIDEERRGPRRQRCAALRYGRRVGTAGWWSLLLLLCGLPICSPVGAARHRCRVVHFSCNHWRCISVWAQIMVAFTHHHFDRRSTRRHQRTAFHACRARNEWCASMWLAGRH